MADPTRLLAKSTMDPEHPRSEETLQGHTAQVVASARVLLAARGKASLVAAGLPADLVPRLEAIVLLAAVIHDLGKVSDHFQGMVRGAREAPQLIRHEALSLWLCWPKQTLSEWLRPSIATDTDYVLAIMAAAGHHRKFWDSSMAADGRGAGTSITLLTGHPDFTNVLNAAAHWLKLAPPPPLTNETITVTRRSDPRRRFEAWEIESRTKIESGSSDTRLLAIAKALVLDADVAGSALPKAAAKHSWIAEQLAQRASADEIRELVTRRLNGKELRPFQQTVARSAAPVTLVTAGTGTGKTLAAYLWCAEQHGGRQLWLTYPTTGTTTEGYRDYVHGADVLGRLEHSRAVVDLDMFDLHDGEQGQRSLDRLDALRAWGAEVVVCTVDTVLGLVQNQRKGLYAWAGLADSAIVFDEIHSYDAALFGCLLRFLEALPGVPVLLMTASLPSCRLRELRELVRRVHGRQLAEIPGPSDLETLPRYRLSTSPDPAHEAAACVRGGGKVLWVSNTVDRCVSVADRSTSPGISPIVYHSRFRYIDRVRRHREVIDAFGSQGSAFASTTQVAEMSLDLSADLLVTDLAPIPALIQRLGRLNRRASPNNPRPACPFIVLPFSGLPYESEHLEEARRWVESLSGRDLSQQDLTQAWKQTDEAGTAATCSEWLDGLFSTRPAPVREGSPGITIVLEEDAPKVRQGSVRPEEVAIPMNPPPGGSGAWRAWPVIRHVPVPPGDSVSYDPKRGAQWRR